MKLEVGKKYVCRNIPNIRYVEITKAVVGDFYVGVPAYTDGIGTRFGLIEYYSNGYVIENFESRLDLVSEYKEKEKIMTLQEQLKEAENKVAEIKKQIADIPKKYEVELWVAFRPDSPNNLVHTLRFSDWNHTKTSVTDRKVKITVEEIIDLVS